MRILVAPCTFKGSLSASQAAAAIARGLRSAGVGAEAEELPLSDGGEGLTDCFLTLPGAERIEAEVAGPLGRPVRASYALITPPPTRLRLPEATPGQAAYRLQPTAVIEMAAAAGLGLVPDRERDPLRTTTRGVGELLLDAARRGARRVILGMGGSATTDGGVGVLAACGVRLLDSAGRELPDGGGELLRLAHIDADKLNPAFRALDIVAASDVDSPLLGPAGAARMFGPQKGASPEAVERLEAGLARLAERLRRDLGRDVVALPGAGAAGGLGAGLSGGLGAKLVAGAGLVMDELGFDRRLAAAGLLVTGEGSLDAQSLRGKAPVAAARRAAAAGTPAVALVGRLRLTPEELAGAGLRCAWEMIELAPPEECLRRAAEILEALARKHAAEMM